MIQLTKHEKRELRVFFETNKEWIENHSLLDEKNINELINMYGEFIEANHLNHSRALLMFIVEMKQESTKARIERSASRIRNLSVNSIPLSARLSNNQTVNIWINASGAEVGEQKRNQDEIDYFELDRIITEQRNKVMLKRAAIEKRKTK